MCVSVSVCVCVWSQGTVDALRGVHALCVWPQGACVCVLLFSFSPLVCVFVSLINEADSVFGFKISVNVYMLDIV